MNTVYTKRKRTLQDLRHEIESVSFTIPLQTVQEICHSVARRHFENSRPQDKQRDSGLISIHFAC